jgi:hypothetical protein
MQNLPPDTTCGMGFGACAGMTGLALVEVEWNGHIAS